MPRLGLQHPTLSITETFEENNCDSPSARCHDTQTPRLDSNTRIRRPLPYRTSDKTIECCKGFTVQVASATQSTTVDRSWGTESASPSTLDPDSEHLEHLDYFGSWSGLPDWLSASHAASPGPHPQGWPYRRRHRGSSESTASSIHQLVTPTASLFHPPHWVPTLEKVASPDRGHPEPDCEDLHLTLSPLQIDQLEQPLVSGEELEQHPATDPNVVSEDYPHLPPPVRLPPASTMPTLPSWSATATELTSTSHPTIEDSLVTDRPERPHRFKRRRSPPPASCANLDLMPTDGNAIGLGIRRMKMTWTGKERRPELVSRRGAANLSVGGEKTGGRFGPSISDKL